jgi:hypothetical protein
MSPEQQFKNKIKTHLNKLTPDNFEIIKKEIIADIGANFQPTIDVILETATKQPKYGSVIAKLCSFIVKKAECGV